MYVVLTPESTTPLLLATYDDSSVTCRGSLVVLTMAPPLRLICPVVEMVTGPCSIRSVDPPESVIPAQQYEPGLSRALPPPLMVSLSLANDTLLPVSDVTPVMP